MTALLKLSTYVGVVTALAGFLYAFALILRPILFGIDVPGNASLMVTVLIMGGVQLISLGALGEYIGRIFLKIKCRLLYVASCRHSFR